MRTLSHRVAPIALLLTALMLAASCSSSSKASSDTTPGSSSSDKVTLRLGYLPNVTHAPAIIGAAEQDVRRPSSGRTSTIKPSTYNSGTDETTALLAGALDAAFVGPNPAINGYQKTERRAHPHRVGRGVGRRVPRREARHHEPGRPEGQEDRDAVARQHAGRRAPHLAQHQGLQGHEGQRRRRHDPPAGQLHDADRVRERLHRRRLGAGAVRDTAPARRAARSSSTRRPSGRRASS